jgi:hypothetical protein
MGSGSGGWVLVMVQERYPVLPSQAELIEVVDFFTKPEIFRRSGNNVVLLILLILLPLLQVELMEVVDFFHQAGDFPTRWRQCIFTCLTDTVTIVAGGIDGGGLLSPSLGFSYAVATMYCFLCY